MVITTVFATAGAIIAGATGYGANITYFNKDNESKSLAWGAAFALCGGLVAGGVGYGIDRAIDALSEGDTTSHVIEHQAEQIAKQDFSTIVVPAYKAA